MRNVSECLYLLCAWLLFADNKWIHLLGLCRRRRQLSLMRLPTKRQSLQKKAVTLIRLIHLTMRFLSCREFYFEQQQQQSFYGPLSGITQVSRYQKKHSPTQHLDHPVFINCFHIVQSIASFLFKLRAWQSFCTISLHILRSASPSEALHLIFYTFLHPILLWVQIEWGILSEKFYVFWECHIYELSTLYSFFGGGMAYHLASLGVSTRLLYVGSS